ncbi:Transcriptional activator NprA [Methanosarcinales archaeon]|nr:Transcriptional activator NprA [Methanosarcinales archaeon]
MNEEEEPLKIRVSRLEGYLTRAYKYNKSSILFAVYLSEFQRVDVEKTLEKLLKEQGLEIVKVDAGKHKNLPDYLSSLNSKNIVFVVHNVEKGFPESLAYLNFKRETIAENHIKVVFWVTEEELTRISREAPDFFAFRNRVIEFMEVPLAEERRPGLVQFAMETEYKSLDEIRGSINLKEKLLSELSGDDEISGYLLGSLGILYDQIGSYRKAIEYYEKALAIAHEIGDRRGEGADLGNLGNAYSDLGQVEKAIEYYEKALAIAHEIGDRRGEGTHLGNLGLAYSHLGHVEKAMDYYEKALTISQEIGDRRGEGNHLGNLGNAYSDLGHVEKAIEYYEKALTISHEIGDRRGEGNRLNNLGVAFKNTKNYMEALACFLRAKDIRTDIKDPNLKTTVANIKELKEKLGEKEFENLETEVPPKAGEIVKALLKKK